MLGQLGHHSFFHAHHHLNGKELRYLRTLKVRAAVYLGFVYHFVHQYWAELTPYTTPYSLAECCVFGKQLQPDSLGILVPLLIPKLRSLFAEFPSIFSFPGLGRLLPAGLCRFHYGFCRSTFLKFTTLGLYPKRSFSEPNTHRQYFSALTLGTAYIGSHNGAR